MVYIGPDNADFLDYCHPTGGLIVCYLAFLSTVTPARLWACYRSRTLSVYGVVCLDGSMLVLGSQSVHFRAPFNWLQKHLAISPVLWSVISLHWNKVTLHLRHPHVAPPLQSLFEDESKRKLRETQQQKIWSFFILSMCWRFFNESQSNFSLSEPFYLHFPGTMKLSAVRIWQPLTVHKNALVLVATTGISDQRRIRVQGQFQSNKFNCRRETSYSGTPWTVTLSHATCCLWSLNKGWISWTPIR